jgi:hypothetical protein
MGGGVEGKQQNGGGLDATRGNGGVVERGMCFARPCLPAPCAWRAKCSRSKRDCGSRQACSSCCSVLTVVMYRTSSSVVARASAQLRPVGGVRSAGGLRPALRACAVGVASGRPAWAQSAGSGRPSRVRHAASARGRRGGLNGERRGDRAGGAGTGCGERVGGRRGDDRSPSERRGASAWDFLLY